MRRLILLRHAKSDRSPGVTDIDRPLNPRGKRAAPRIGEYLASEGLKPEAVVISPSLRTRQTWEALQPGLKAPEPEVVPSIYEAPEATLLSVVQSTTDSAASLLMIGHNPGLQELALRLAASGDRTGRKRLTVEFPTAALAVIDFEVDTWTSVTAGLGHLERFVAPRDIHIED